MARIGLTLVILWLACLGGPQPVQAAPEASGLPLPRFVSLRSDRANMRTGPGEQYPIKWIYQRPGLPLEIIAEYYNWRHVRDWQGGEGWMHVSMLTGRRYVIVVGPADVMRAKPDATAAAVAALEAGVIARLLQCRGGADWCQLEAEGRKGWVPRSALWGIYATENIE